jgi:hypothetical protein
MKTFNYGKSYKIIFWGCQFDSLLELKYAISIMKDYEFLRSRVVVYYDPKTKMPSNYIREGIKRYTPDFLIRHKTTGEALWVEVKPRAFTNTAELSLRREVAENYIKWKRFDWKYKVVYDDEIKLDAEQWKLYKECCGLKSKSAYKIHFGRMNNRFDRSAPPLFSSTLLNTSTEYVMFGTRKQIVMFKG